MRHHRRRGSRRCRAGTGRRTRRWPTRPAAPSRSDGGARWATTAMPSWIVDVACAGERQRDERVEAERRPQPHAVEALLLACARRARATASRLRGLGEQQRELHRGWASRAGRRGSRRRARTRSRSSTTTRRRAGTRPSPRLPRPCRPGRPAHDARHGLHRVGALGQPAAQHRRVDRTGVDRVHADPLARRARSPPTRVRPAQRELRRRVPGDPPRSDEAVHRRDVHDAPAARGDDRGRHHVDAGERADLVDVDHLAVLVDRRLDDRLRRQADARVVHQRVDPTERGDRGVERCSSSRPPTARRGGEDGRVTQLVRERLPGGVVDVGR